MKTIAIAVMSLDGRITRHDEAGVAFASQADQDWFFAEMKDFSASVFGRRTYEVIAPNLKASMAPSRLRLVMTRNPDQYAAATVPGQLEFTDATPSGILSRLREAGHERVALLGGREVYDQFIQDQCVDELWLTLEPRLFGTGNPLLSAKTDQQLEFIDSTPLSKDVLLLKYRLLRP